MINPLSSTPEWKAGVKLYKENLLKYQSGPKWYFGMIEKGIDWDDQLMTMEDLQKRIKNVSPIGPAVPVSEVVDVTPSWEFCTENFGQYIDYDKYTKWVSEQTDTFYYSRGKEEFFRWEAFEIASKLGYRKVILENLS